MTRANHNPFNKLPPQALDAERGVLGSIMCHSEYLDEVTPILKPEHFYLDAHRKMFEVIQKLGERDDRGIDALTVKAELERRGWLDEIGGDAYLVKVVESVPHSAHAKYYAGIVRKYANLRALVYAGTEMVRDAYEGADDADSVLEKCAEVVLGLMEDQAEGSETFHQIGLRSIDRLSSPRPQGINLGFRELDEHLYGAKGELILIAARPSVGKTAFACNIIDNVSARAGVFFASAEITKDGIWDRIMCSRLNISLSELRPMARDEYRRSQVDDVRTSLSQLPIVVDDSTAQSVASITAHARLIKRKQGLGLIVVDYLQLLQPANRRDPREQQVAGIGDGLRCLAKNLNVPVIALAQLNREKEKRDKGGFKMSDLRESGALEQHAQVIMFLDRPALTDPENFDDTLAEIHLKKNRDGRIGKIDLTWNGKSGTFTDPDLQSDLPRVPDVDFGP